MRQLGQVGGNIRIVGTKPDGSGWVTGVKDPANTEQFAVKLMLTDTSCVTSGSYERYYTVDGVRYHHIIDPDTRMPLTNFDSVTILCNDSGKADALSTALFNMTIPDGKVLLENLEGVDAIWVLPDGSYDCTEGFAKLIID